jgi:hypothetical protein
MGSLFRAWRGLRRRSLKLIACLLQGGVVALDVVFEITKLLQGKTLLSGGSVDRKASVALHSFVHRDVFLDLVGRNFVLLGIILLADHGMLDLSATDSLEQLARSDAGPRDQRKRVQGDAG